MQVFKTYFKIINKTKMQIMIYVIVFLVMSVLFVSLDTNSGTTEFSAEKSRVAFFNYDKDSELVKDLRKFLEDRTNLVEIEDDSKSIQDALFFRDAEYIVKIPEGFYDDLKAGKEASVIKTSLPGSASNMYVDMLVERYLSTAWLYFNNASGLSDEDIIKNINIDLSKETQVKLDTYFSDGTDITAGEQFANFISYTIFAVLILGVSTVMLAFTAKDIRARNLAAPLKIRSYNAGLAAGNICFMLLVWAVFMVASGIMQPSVIFSKQGLLIGINLFVFCIAALGISFLIANIVKSRNAMSAAANVVALGTSFISGAFVPQFLLGDTVLSIARFTPNYWYIKANSAIFAISDFGGENLWAVLKNTLVVAGFAVAFFTISFIYIKIKAKSIQNSF